MNNSDLLICDPNDSATKTAIRNITKGGELDFNSIPKGAYWGEDTNVESLKPSCDCEIKIKQISCNEVRVFGICKNFAFGDGGGVVNMFLTNSPFFPTTGSIPPIQTHNVDGNFSFIITLSNSFSIFFHASADPNCFFNNLATATLEFDPDEDTCDPNEKDTAWLWAQDNGVQGLSHRTSYYKNFWSTYAAAEMYSKWWDGSQWKKSKQQLRVNIDEIRKNDQCQQWDHESETKTCDQCDHKRARINSGINAQDFVFHCDGDVTGTYSKTMNWQGMTWSIDAVGEVDFECCE